MAVVDSQKHHTSMERPDWFNCDLRPCLILQDVSAEIVETCQSLGGHLEDVCRRACKQLPSEAEAASCLSFLAAFGVLSSALLSVAVDLESTVTKPLEKTIRTLEEESNGRLKHWQQVRLRFAELQERYRRSRQRSLEARDRLATSSTSGIFFKSSKSAAKAAASEQHAAMCELAKCEEELLRSEASLRALEEESRKRIDQLELEKNAFLQGVMAKGTGTLRRLLPIAAKVPPEDAPAGLPSPEEWQGVLPPSGGGAKEQWGQEDVRALVAATDAAEAASAEMFGRLPSEDSEPLASAAGDNSLGTSPPSLAMSPDLRLQQRIPSTSPPALAASASASASAARSAAGDLAEAPVQAASASPGQAQGQVPAVVGTSPGAAAAVGESLEAASPPPSSMSALPLMAAAMESEAELTQKEMKGGEAEDPSSNPAANQAGTEVVDVQSFQGIVLQNDHEKAPDDKQESAQDPSLKYLQDAGARPAKDTFEEIDDGSDGENEPETLLSRAAHWTPQVKTTGAQSVMHKKSLVFQSATPITFAKSGGPKLISSVGQAPSASAAGSAPFTLGRLSSFGEDVGSSSAGAGCSSSGGSGSLLQRVNQTVNKAIGPARGGQPLPGTSPTLALAAPGDADLSSATAGPSPGESFEEVGRAAVFQQSAGTGHGLGAGAAAGSAAGGAGASAAAPAAGAAPSSSSSPAFANPTFSAAASPSSSSFSKPAAQAAAPGKTIHRKPSDDSDSDGEMSRSGTVKRLPVVPLENADFDFGLSPVVTEDPRTDFERYILRLDDHQLGSTEADWERLQAKAKEHLQGAHVGKLELWWIHGPGVLTTPETADGLVCFQFVQSCSSNFARVLHLSVVGSSDGSGTWQEMLPSAIFEVRRLILGTLPVDSVRAIVTSVADEQGKLYVDGHVENAYEQCRFRWFQLTQSLRRTKSSGLIIQKRKTLTSRFLVLNTYRTKSDPAAPRSGVKRLAPLLLHDDHPQAEGGATSSGPTLDRGGSPGLAGAGGGGGGSEAAASGFTSF